MTIDTCGVRHAQMPPGLDIDVRDPDDELVAHRAFVHIERTSKHGVYVGIHTADGMSITVQFSSRTRLRMDVSPVA